MAVNINWSLNVQVAGGPKITGTDTLEVDAYDIVEATVPKKPAASPEGTISVPVQPSEAAKVKLLIIKSSVYKDLTYKVDGGSITVTLDAQQLLIGSGVVGLLGGDPKTLVFANKGTADASVQILVGRKAS